MKKLLTIIILLIPLASFAKVNKCLINGKTVYTDKKCPANTAQKYQPKMINRAQAQQGEYSSPLWYKDNKGYQRALQVSEQQKAPIIIYGYTDWCGYCKKLERFIFHDADVKNILKQFVKIKLNPEHSQADKKTFQSWGGTGYPTLMIQTEVNDPPRRLSNPFSGNMDKAKAKNLFITQLKQKLENYRENTP